ncbi:hypothetical protein [Aeromicrobium sp. UC242_57]|uniref:hypothetical protein n=1 Tax=Aeromicrobium sp. UC242_57 TaxID=3374624 RepID=UPI0037A3475C
MLDAYSAAQSSLVTRHEDNAGHKIIVANNVSVIGANPRTTVKDDAGNPIKCDYLIKFHQGSHSSDATKNNAHETLYGLKCTDGTEVISSTFTRYGNANEFDRTCDQQKVVTSGSILPDGFGGRRLIPDTYCVNKDVLVPGNQQSNIWSLYEVWESANRIQKADGTELAASTRGSASATPRGCTPPESSARSWRWSTPSSWSTKVTAAPPRGIRGASTRASTSRRPIRRHRSTERSATTTCRARRSRTRPARTCGGPIRTATTPPPRRRPGR